MKSNQGIVRRNYKALIEWGNRMDRLNRKTTPYKEVNQRPITWPKANNINE